MLAFMQELIDEGTQRFRQRLIKNKYRDEPFEFALLRSPPLLDLLIERQHEIQELLYSQDMQKLFLLMAQNSIEADPEYSARDVRDVLTAWSSGFILASKEIQATQKQQPKPQPKLDISPPVDDGMDILVDYIKNNPVPQFRDYIKAFAEEKPVWDAINRKNTESKRARMEMQLGYVSSQAAQDSVNLVYDQIKKSDEAIKRRKRFFR